MAGIPFNNTLSQDVPSNPPYHINGITTQGFFLKADPTQLAYFVDCYLNIVPPEVAVFRPAAPYVLLLVIHQKESGQAPLSGGIQYGFVDESQVCFAIPLIQYQKRGGRLVMVDFTMLMPFVFASDQSSVSIMSLTCGWPTTLGWVAPHALSAQLLPDAWRRNVTVKGPTIPTLWQGRRQETRHLLEIISAPPWSFQWPMRVGSGWHPLDAGPNLLKGAVSAGAELGALFRWWCASGLLNQPGALLRMLIRNLKIDATSPALGSGTVVSLKQFRDAENQDLACYQALLSAQMVVTALDKVGLMGCSALLRGDLTGGYRIRLPQYEALPIVSRLGLEVATWESGRTPQGLAQSYTNDRSFDYSSMAVLPKPGMPPVGSPAYSVAVLEPTLPFWSRMNMTYSSSNVKCWRLRDSRWFVPRNFKGPRHAVETSKPEPGGSPYNSTLGTANTAPAGPYNFSQVTTRVLPLRASNERLQKLCDEYINQAPEIRFEAWGHHVFMMATRYGQMTSDSENIGNWNDREVEFAFPVKWFVKGEFVGVALVAPYIFSESHISVATGAQILGLNVHLAHVTSPSESWMSVGGPTCDQPLLHLWAYTYPALTMGTYPQRIVLLEVVRNAETDARPKAACESLDAGEVPEQPSFMRKLGVSTFHGSRPIPLIALKQFPGSNAAVNACYQAIVCHSKTIERVEVIEPLPAPLIVRIHHNPLFPIVDMLGLVVEETEMGVPARANHVWQGSTVSVVRPEQPFWWMGDLRLADSFNVCSRAPGSPEWTSHKQLSKKLTRLTPAIAGHSRKETLDALRGTAMGPHDVLRALLEDGRYHQGSTSTMAPCEFAKERADNGSGP